MVQENKIQYAVLFAGGEGSRLAPLTDKCSKPMINLCGKTLIERQIELIAASNVKKIILSLKNHASDIIKRIPYWEAKINVEISYNIEDSFVDTAGALSLVFKKFPFLLHEEGILMSYTDLYTNFDLIELMRSFFEQKEKHGAIATLAAIRVEDPKRFGCLKIDNDNKIMKFLSKPKTDSEIISNQIFAGMLCIVPSFIEFVLEDQAVNLDDALINALKCTDKIYSYEDVNCYWFDVGIPKDYMLAQAHCLKTLDAKRYNIDPSYYLGDNVVIGKGTILKNCTIFEGTVIGDDVEIVNAVIGRNCKIKDGVLIGDESSGVTLVKDGLVLESPRTKFLGKILDNTNN